MYIGTRICHRTLGGYNLGIGTVVAVTEKCFKVHFDYTGHTSFVLKGNCTRY
jgi:hypothetical protein